MRGKTAEDCTEPVKLTLVVREHPASDGWFSLSAAAEETCDASSCMLQTWMQSCSSFDLDTRLDNYSCHYKQMMLFDIHLKTGNYEGFLRSMNGYRFKINPRLK